MPLGRFFLITTVGAVVVWLALARGLGPTLNSLIETAPPIETVLRCTSLLANGGESNSPLAAERTEPGIAAFVEVEGGLFRVLVGRDTEGEAWSAAVSGGQ
jgi:hypothetical protein